MIIPRDIVEFVKNREDLRDRFPDVLAIDELHVSGTPIAGHSTDFEEWMLTEGHRESHAIARYVYFVNLMSRIFCEVHRFFEKENPDGRQGHDTLATGTRNDELLAIARYLYYLDSYGVPGCVLECGSFKGWCCFPH